MEKNKSFVSLKLFVFLVLGVLIGLGFSANALASEVCQEDIMCYDENECTLDTCNFLIPELSYGECSYEVLPDGTTCMGDGSCQEGVCITPMHPFVWTEKSNYESGETVKIYGMQFDYNSVDIKITIPSNPLSYDWIYDVSVSPEHNIYAEYLLVDGIVDHYNIDVYESGKYDVVLASTSFYDDPAIHTVIFNVTDDSYINKFFGSFNYGNLQTVVVSDSETFTRRGYVNFDLSDLGKLIPSGSNILSANVKLMQTNCPDSTASNAVEYSVYRIDESWSEDTLTWLNKPGNPSDTTYRINISGKSGNVSLNVTSDLISFFEGSMDNYGWMLKSSRENNFGGSRRTRYFCSKESSPMCAPVLEVQYQLPPNCSDYANMTSCQADSNCKWCADCNTYFIFNGASQCVDAEDTCSYNGCDTTCGAQCESDSDCADKCVGDVLYTSGTCGLTTCDCSYSSTFDCDSLDGWYNTTDVTNQSYSDCQWRLRVVQEERDYYCATDGCDYTTTGNTQYTYGPIMNKEDGIKCDDGLFCTTPDSCTAGACSGPARDCSANDISEISTCSNNPDNIAYTWDSRTSFTSSCDETNDLCTTGDETITHTCSISQCDAECEDSGDCENQCVGDILNSAGVCTDGCTCIYIHEDCGSYSGDYETGNSRWVDSGVCVEKEQIEKETRAYYCDSVLGCDYDVTNTFWEDTQNTQNKAYGTPCDDGDLCTENDICDEGSCMGAPMDCSSYDVTGIASCYNTPDGIDYTWDYRANVPSQCVMGVCTTGDETITHTCSISNCGAQCESDSDCADKCVGDVLYTSGTCGLTTCDCSYSSTFDCDSLDGWYNTTDVTNQSYSDCQWRLRVVQEERDYYCATDGCDYTTTGNTQYTYGPIMNKEDGIKCDDGLFCTTPDSCTAGACSGPARDCSANDISEISTCSNNPDNIAYTWDSRTSFTSSCDETNDLCTTGDETITHTCSISQCDAECEDSGDCENQCVGDILNSAGVCTDGCTCIYIHEDCGSYSGDYETGNSRWVDSGVCVEKEQIEKETRAYYCDSVLGCDYDVTNTFWEDTQNTQNKAYGTPCDDGDLCTENDICDEGSCMGAPMDCSSYDVTGIASCYNTPDGIDYTWDYRANVPSQCVMGVCTTGDETITHTCSINNCGAECESDSDCADYSELSGDYCYFGGDCDATCSCASPSEEYCPVPGTVFNNICYYGKRACTTEGCSISSRELDEVCGNYCDPIFGPIDGTGPITSNLEVVPNPASLTLGYVEITATETEDCVDIETAEYFFDPTDSFTCSDVKPGTGQPLYASDGSYDSLVEDVYNDYAPLVKYIAGIPIPLSDGAHTLCVRGKNVNGIWGNCKCVPLDIDSIPPETHETSLNGIINATELLICGENPTLRHRACDSETYIQLMEYFVRPTDDFSDAVNWQGIPMDPVDGSYLDDFCEEGIAVIDISNLPDGTNYVKAHAKDAVENWFKLTAVPTLSFIKDTTAPDTTKELYPYDKQMVECSLEEFGGYNLDAGCYYVLQGTTITLSAVDPDPQGTNEFAGDVKIKYIVWWKLNEEDNWTKDSEGESDIDSPVTITLDKDSYHLIEYWAVDGCGNEEEHHFELDIVDTKAPISEKEVGSPKVAGGQSEIDTFYGGVSPTDGVYYVTQQTPITITCTDQEPHPVNDVVIYYRSYLFGESKPSFSLEEDDSYTFTYSEDSAHVLEWYCVDALGNVETTHVEYDIVDTLEPKTTKTITGPQINGTGDVHKYITNETVITLDCTDQNPHPVGGETLHWELYWTYECTAIETPRALENGWELIASGDELNGRKEITGLNDSCHMLVYSCEDALGNSEEEQIEIDAVDNLAPISNKHLGIPSIAGNQSDIDEFYGGVEPTDGVYYVTQSTPVTLTCSDQFPHPVNDVTLHYRHYLAGEVAPDFTRTGSQITFTYPEDSAHILEWYCVDALGNEEELRIEYDIVDTLEPKTTKTITGPQVNGTGDIHKYITKESVIALNCLDQDPHPVGGETLFWEIYWSEECVDPESDDWQFISDGEESTGYVEISELRDSCHKLVYWCVDDLKNTEEKQIEIDAVDNNAPRSEKEVGLPKHSGGQYEIDTFYDGIDPTDGTYYVTQETPITINCTDVWPHPVNGVEIYYRSYLFGESKPSFSVEKDDSYTFTYDEDSAHVLEWYCVDALGNEEELRVEYDIVDTLEPKTTKTITGPQVNGTGDIHKYITSDSIIRLDCVDQQPHPVGEETLYWELYWSEECIDPKSDWGQTIGSGVEADGSVEITDLSDSCHKLVYWCEDKLGNMEEIEIEIDAVDNSHPTVSKELIGTKIATEETYSPSDQYEVNDQAYYITQNTQVSLTCSDVEPHPVEGEEIYYKIYNDGVLIKDWTKYTDPFTYGEDTWHELYYYCEDALGNRGETHRELDIVDTEPPVSYKEIDGPVYRASNEDVAKFDLTPGEAGVFWLRDHTSLVTIYSEDPAPHPIGLDYVHIELWWDSDKDDTIDTMLWEIDVDATDMPYNFTIDEDCLHLIKWYGVDLLGNAEDTHEQYHRVDSTPPQTQKTFVGPTYSASADDISLYNLEAHEIDNFYVSSETEITLTPVDKEEPCAVGIDSYYYELWWDSDCDGVIDYALDRGQVSGDTPTTFNFKEECLHEIRWGSVDLLGNVEAEVTQRHKVDNSAPHILILKPVNGWYSDGESIPAVVSAIDMVNPHGSCELSDEHGCVAGIEDGKLCKAYLVDVSPEFKIVELESHLYYNENAMECQGYAKLVDTAMEIEDGIAFFAVSVEDNVGNEGNSIEEILHAISMNCGESPLPGCIGDVIQDIVTIWNLPKIGIDNQGPTVTITEPVEYVDLCGESTYHILASVTDGEDGDVTSSISSGTPCYITVDGITAGSVPFDSNTGLCDGYVTIPKGVSSSEDVELTVSIRDNSGNLGLDTILVAVDNKMPKIDIIYPNGGSTVSGIVSIEWTTDEITLDQISIDGSDPETAISPYDWDTTIVAEGAHMITITATDDCGFSAEKTIILNVDNIPDGSGEDPNVAPEKVSVWGEEIEAEPYDTDGSYNILWTDSYDDDGIGSYDIMINEDVFEGVSYPYAELNLDGTYTYKVRALDTLGKAGEWSDSYTVIVDTTPPEIMILNPISDGVYGSTTTLSVMTNENAVCEFSFDSSFEGYDQMSGETTIHSAQLEFLSEGSNTVYVRCVDIAGHSSESNVTFTVTDERPQTFATVIDPYYSFEGAIITAQTLSMTNPIEEAKYCIRRPGETRPLTDETSDCFVFSANDGSFDETREAVESVIDITGFDEGTWVAYTNSKDLTGWGEYDAELFIIDRVPPMIEILFPDETGIVKGYCEDILLERGLEENGDDYAYCGVDIEIKANTNEEATCAYSVDEGEEIAFENGDWTLMHLSTQLFMTDGVHTIDICCKDYTNGGNGETCVSREFVVDSVAPVAYISNLLEVSKESFTVGWSGEDNIGGVGVAFYDVQYTYNLEAEWVDWMIETKDRQSTFSAEQGDTIYFRVRATDLAGNVGEYSNSAFTYVDDGAPIIVSSSPSGTTDTREITLMVETDETSTCQFATEQFEYGLGTDFETSDGLTHAKGISLDEDGRYVYYVKCSDTNGNVMETSEEVIFSVDTSSNFCWTQDLNPVWSSFYLPKYMIDEILGAYSHPVEEVLASLEDEFGYPYSVVWYFDGTNWLSYDPNAESWANSLYEFNDILNNPYWIKMLREDRLELECNGGEIPA